MLETVRSDRESDVISLLSSLLGASPRYAILATDLGGTILLWNAGARQIYGYEDREILGRNLGVLHRPEDVRSGQIEEIFATTLHTGRWEGTVHRVHRSGESFPTRVDFTLRRDRHLRPIGFLGISKDITEEMVVSQRLVASEEYNRILVDSSFDGLFVMDPDGRITDVNRAFALMVGQPRDRLIGTALRSLAEPGWVAEGAVQRVLGQGSVADLELQVRIADGSLRLYALNAGLIPQDGRHGREIIAAIRDVTEQKRLSDMLAQRNRDLEAQNDRVRAASRAKSEFLASMSHELRTPLNSIIGFSDFLLTGTEETLSPRVAEYLGIILNSGNHLLHLINDILDLAKVESGTLPITPAPVQVPEIVDEVCATLLPQIEERRLTLHRDLDATTVRILVDPVRFRQVLYNLLSNAVKFTPPGGSIQITFGASDSAHMELNVTDSGIGIPAEDIPRIFRAFEQLDNGPGKLYEGTGLGLPLTEKLVRRMGGSIDVHSRVGCGSTFTVRLPVGDDALPRAGPRDLSTGV